MWHSRNIVCAPHVSIHSAHVASRHFWKVEPEMFENPRVSFKTVTVVLKASKEFRNALLVIWMKNVSFSAG